eukprot:TRINITY_DN6969_c0_g1_i5.p1 TRINITY_DN6969_c0_g1~~TRINITY_DN6969_c0_g1_i5.p1  ORF type:complete len:782 (+),score=119.15 TRINITY_DN6969_c0_g1_i5:48-2348(+)
MACVDDTGNNRENQNANSSNTANVRFTWPRGSVPSQNLSMSGNSSFQNPLHQLSQSFQTAQNNLVSSAKNHPHVQKLVSSYAEIEQGVKKTLTQLPSQTVQLLGDQELLKRTEKFKAATAVSLPKASSAFGLSTFGFQKDSLQDGAHPSDWTDVGKALHQHFTRAVSSPTLTPRSSSHSQSQSNLADHIRDKSKSAIQSIQQTANNCQQNMQTLSSYITQIPENIAVHVQENFRKSYDNLEALDSSGNQVVMYPKGVYVPEIEEALLLEEEKKKGPFQLQAERRKLEKFSTNNQKKSLRDPGRRMAIYTTASLPWMTGTAINPLLRAAYLAKESQRKVTLVIPWLSPKDQEKVYPNNLVFKTPEDQETYVRNWVEKRTGFQSNFSIRFYPGRYDPAKVSIIPVGDPTQYVPDHEADVAVLEEPEHLNWYHHGRRWTDKFKHVVGVVHTNYLDYVRREEGGNVKEFLVKNINKFVCGIHCHKVIKLSDAVQDLPRQTTMFVHGVSPSFLEVGKKMSEEISEGTQEVFNKGAYFLGKVLWAKGYTELIDLLDKHQQAGQQKVHFDIFGSGPDAPAVQQLSAQKSLDFTFMGAKDHLDSSIQDYKVFVNPSTSDVVATTTAEALAMGKFVVCADLPCNQFFKSFNNCLIYKSPEEFSEKLQYAMEHTPRPLTESEQHSLTWEAATDRFLDIAELSDSDHMGPLEGLKSNLMWTVFNGATNVESLRLAAGAAPNTRDNPQRITDFVPTDSLGGLFDNKNRAKAAYAQKQQ